jgi:hypothetical protein
VQPSREQDTTCLVQLKIACDSPRLPPSYVARWDVVVSSGPHDAAPAARADIHATYWIGMTYFMTASLDSVESPCNPVRTSRHKLPRRPGRARGLARPDGGRNAVHLGRPFADQDWPDMAVVQDGAATAARAGKPLCAAVVSVSAVCTDLRWVNCAMVQAVGESPVGSARKDRNPLPARRNRSPGTRSRGATRNSRAQDRDAGPCPQKSPLDDELC